MVEWGDGDEVVLAVMGEEQCSVVVVGVVLLVEGVVLLVVGVVLYGGSRVLLLVEGMGAIHEYYE